MATKRAARRPTAKNPPAPKDKPTKSKAASPRRGRLTPAQAELLEQVGEAARTGDYAVLKTADQTVLQSLWDLGLIKVREVLHHPGVTARERARIRKSIVEAMKEDETNPDAD